MPCVWYVDPWTSRPPEAADSRASVSGLQHKQCGSTTRPCGTPWFLVGTITGSPVAGLGSVTLGEGGLSAGQSSASAASSGGPAPGSSCCLAAWTVGGQVCVRQRRQCRSTRHEGIVSATAATWRGCGGVYDRGPPGPSGSWTEQTESLCRPGHGETTGRDSGGRRPTERHTEQRVETADPSRTRTTCLWKSTAELDVL